MSAYVPVGEMVKVTGTASGVRPTMAASWGMTPSRAPSTTAHTRHWSPSGPSAWLRTGPSAVPSTSLRAWLRTGPSALLRTGPSVRVMAQLRPPGPASGWPSRCAGGRRRGWSPATPAPGGRPWNLTEAVEVVSQARLRLLRSLRSLAMTECNIFVLLCSPEKQVARHTLDRSSA